MATEAGTDRDAGSEGAIMIEFDVGQVERLDRPSSSWTALVIALFTALTCLGLGASVVLPRAVESAPRQPSERPGDGSPLPTTPSGLVASADRPHMRPATPVEAIARIATVGDGGRIVRIAGQAAVTVRSLNVTLALAGRTIAGAAVAVAPEATLTAAMGTSGVGAAPWSVDLALPSLGDAGIHDDAATVEVSWPPSPAGPAGALALVVSLGDGRGR